MTVDSAIVQPYSSTALFGLGLLGMVASAIPAFVELTVPTARRIYWAGWTVAAVFLGVAGASRGIATGLAFFGTCVFVAVLRAYFVTPYLKVGDRIVTFFGKNAGDTETRVDGYAGGVSATKQWWLLAVLMVFGAASVLVIGWAWQSMLIAVFLVVLATIAGVDDATRKLPPARGQRIQACIIAAASIAMAGLPVLAYVVGFQLRKRRPRSHGLHDPLRQGGDDETAEHRNCAS